MKTLTTYFLIVLPPETEKMDKYSISTSHKLGPLTRGGPRDIFVRFVRYSDKVVVYANKSNLKGFKANLTNNYQKSLLTKP